MKKILYIIPILAILCTSCVDNGYIDTGLADGQFDGTTWEYLNAPGEVSSYNWDSTALIIERADLVDLFDGKLAGREKITFFGPTNLSIMKWMFANSYDKVEDIPVQECHDLMLKYVIEGAHMVKDIPVGVPPTGGASVGEGGTDEITTLGGNNLWLYQYAEAYKPTPTSPITILGAGATVIRLVSIALQVEIKVASSDIQTDNGIVHSLNYGHYFGEI